MRVFVAGGSGLIGVRLVPLLLDAGHSVAAMTRSPHKTDMLRALGATPVVCDVFDGQALTAAVEGFGAQAVIHQLTDLPDDVAQIGEYAGRNDRIRSEGTRNLLAAAQAAGAERFLAQSIAWKLPGGRGETLVEHERQVLDAGGLVIRYGQLYGPGSYYEDRLPPAPRIHVDEAARATVPMLDQPSGIVVVVEE